VAGKNEVDTGTLELCAEQQLRVRDDNGVRRNVRGMNGLGKKVIAGLMAQRIKDLGIKFAEVIHPAPPQWLINIQFQKTKLPYHPPAHRETISCLQKTGPGPAGAGFLDTSILSVLDKAT
jgi:hypothetical protein